MNRIFHGSSEQMNELDDDSVTLTVTSPPYWNAIDYDRHVEDDEQNYRTRTYNDGFHTYESYLDWMTNIFGETKRKTRPGGFLAIVIGTVLLDGDQFPVPFDLTSRLTREGWEFWQDIIWHKVTGGVKRAGVYIQHPYPGYYRPNIMTEYILIFRKPGRHIYKQYSQEEKQAAAGDINKLFTNEIANNVWHIAPVPPGQLDHPCPYPEEIPFRLVQLYSYPGDLVLDPFNGSGQTTKVAYHLGRQYVGWDRQEKYVNYARERLDEPLAVRPHQLVSEVKKIAIDQPRDGGKRKHQKTRHGAGLAVEADE